MTKPTVERVDREAAAKTLYAASFDSDPVVMQWIETGEWSERIDAAWQAPIIALALAHHREQAVAGERASLLMTVLSLDLGLSREEHRRLMAAICGERFAIIVSPGILEETREWLKQPTNEASK